MHFSNTLFKSSRGITGYFSVDCNLIQKRRYSTLGNIIIDEFSQINKKYMCSLLSVWILFGSLVGAVSDLINDRLNGIMFKPKDITALLNALQQLVANKFQHEIFASRAAEKIITNHSLESVVPTLKGIL